MWVAFANAKATHIFFSKNISINAIFNDQSFNDTLTNDIVSFEQLGPDVLFGNLVFLIPSSNFYLPERFYRICLKLNMTFQLVIQVTDFALSAYECKGKTLKCFFINTVHSRCLE